MVFKIFILDEGLENGKGIKKTRSDEGNEHNTAVHVCIISL